MQPSRFRPAVVLFVVLATMGCATFAAEQTKTNGEDEEKPLLSAATFEGLELRSIGPALMSGRVADIAVHPEDQSTWYVGVGSGGVWKTTNAGTTWTPIFDEESSYSIGTVTVDPNDPSVVWVGTGENVDGRHVGYGDGVYRSRDGGASWENMGLKESEHIGSIVVDPRDSNVVYVAAKGPLWSPGGERGLYKTIDGGKTWKNVLSAGEYTGVNEVVMDPSDPDTLYASTHQRHRTVAALIDGGPESGIHKSTDGGETWRELEKGLPEEDMGRIGLAVSSQDPEVVYATIELAHREGGFYRSEDGGESWEKRSDYLSGGTGPHYYQEIFASPHQFDRVYQMDVRLHVTEDGGKTWTSLGTESKHVDNHALAFDPRDPEYLLVGCDGGLYQSWDLGETWKFVSNLPVTQFYKVAVDSDTPFYNIYGGTQDNNTQGGPSRTDTVHGIRNSDWFVTLFGDGHQPAVDPMNPDIVYSEWQQGNLVRHDRATGEIVYIKPQPEPGDPPERFNWDAPILVSPHDPARLYYASQRLWRSDDRGDSWQAISGDLTRNQDRLKLPLMGRVWSVDAIWDLWAMSYYNTITSLAESPLEEGLLWVGTDDGLVQVSEDGGESWRRIDTAAIPGVPENAFVNDIKAGLFDADTVYVAFDDHKTGDFAPYLVKSTDRGRSWRSMVGDLPDRHLVWRLVQDHVNPDLFFVGTEFGIFFTLDGGERWIELDGGVPTISFRDLAIQRRENDLVGASFGRGFFVFDDYSLLRGMSKEVLEREVELFGVRDAWWYVPRRTLGFSQKASQGDAFFTAPNPPFGAVVTYYLKEKIQTRKEARREREEEIEEEGGDTPYPGWEELEREAREEDPVVLLTVRDENGDVVRRITGPVEKGFHRVAWDLRYPPPDAITSPEPSEEEEFLDVPQGFMAPPGTYTVRLAKRVDGEVTDLGLEQSFEVVPMTAGTLEGADPETRTAFAMRLTEAMRVGHGIGALIEELQNRLGSIQRALIEAKIPGGELDERVLAMQDRLADHQKTVYGDPVKDQIGEPTVPGAMDRLQVAFLGNRWSLYGPTPTHLRSVDIAEGELAAVREALETFQTDLDELEAALEAAGVPWTPGRGVP